MKIPPANACNTNGVETTSQPDAIPGEKALPAMLSPKKKMPKLFAYPGLPPSSFSSISKRTISKGASQTQRGADTTIPYLTLISANETGVASATPVMPQLQRMHPNNESTEKCTSAPMDVDPLKSTFQITLLEDQSNSAMESYLGSSCSPQSASSQSTSSPLSSSQSECSESMEITESAGASSAQECEETTITRASLINDLFIESRKKRWKLDKKTFASGLSIPETKFKKLRIKFIGKNNSDPHLTEEEIYEILGNKLNCNSTELLRVKKKLMAKINSAPKTTKKSSEKLNASGKARTSPSLSPSKDKATQSVKKSTKKPLKSYHAEIRTAVARKHLSDEEAKFLAVKHGKTVEQVRASYKGRDNYLTLQIFM